jgi:hypothetical protein
MSRARMPGPRPSLARTLALALGVSLAVAPGCAERSRDEATSAALGASGEPAPAPVPALPKGPVLVRHGSLVLIVADAKAAEAKILELLQTYGGYVAGRQSSASIPAGRALAPSEVRSVTLTLKVDAKQFDVFLMRVKAVGSYTSEEVQVDDVTLAYMDLNARLANQKRVEERLVALLRGEAAKDIAAVLEVERELGRVREVVEQLSTQLRSMDDQISYSTLAVTLSVQPEWVPPEERTFGADVSDAVGASLLALGGTARAGLILLLAALPWLAVVGAAGAAVGLVVRRKRKP